MIKPIPAKLLALSAAFCASAAIAAPIDSATATLSGPVIDFEGMVDGTLIDTQYAGLTFSQDDGGRPMIDNSPFLYGYTSNSGAGVLTGSTEGGAPFPTVAGIVAIFDSPVSAVEAFLSDTAPLGDYTVSAFDSGGTLLESFSVSGANGAIGRFFGFSRASNDIASVQWGPGAAYGDAFAIDDLRFDRVGVAEPGSLAILGIGLLGFWLSRRRIS